LATVVERFSRPLKRLEGIAQGKPSRLALLLEDVAARWESVVV